MFPILNNVFSMLDGQCFMSDVPGTTSSSNTMVPGNDGHHDGKIKDSNMEDRYGVSSLSRDGQTCIRWHVYRIDHQKVVIYAHYV